MATKVITAILVLGIASTGCVSAVTNDPVAEAALAKLHEMQAAKKQAEAELRDARKRIDVCENAMDGLQKQLDFQSRQRTELAALVYRLNLSEGTTVTDVEFRDVYQAQLRDANGRIAALEEVGKSKDDRIASLVKETHELAEMLRKLTPPSVGSVPWQPDFGGRVTHVEGNLCAIRITENPKNAGIQPGYRLHVFDATRLKGWARVTDWDKDRSIVFCTIEWKAGSEAIEVGDAARTWLWR